MPVSVSADEVYKVVHVKPADSLNLRAYPSSKSRIKVAIPHNATWVKKQGREKRVGGALWSKVSWNREEGWVNTYYLGKDERATRLLGQRMRCLANAQEQQRRCCGYPASRQKQPFKHVAILAVKGIAPGKTLSLRTSPGKGRGKILVAIPHNATWLSASGSKKVLDNGKVWQQVRWNGQSGWVNSANVVLDRQATRLADRTRQLCTRSRT